VCFSMFSVPVCLCFVKMPGTHHRKYGGSLLQSCFLIRTELLLSLMCRFAFFISILFDGLRTLALLVPHVLSPPWTWSRDMTYFDAVNLFATWLNCVSSNYSNNSPPRWLDYSMSALSLPPFCVGGDALYYSFNSHSCFPLYHPLLVWPW